MGNRTSERAPGCAIYLDSSALIKLVVEEPETAALRDVLGEDPGIVCSEIVLVEIPRAVQRLTTGLRRPQRDALFAAAESVLRAVALVPVTTEELTAAGRLNADWLRSLDAIHLVAALEASEDIELFVTYDKRQATAGEKLGLTVESPGG